LEVTFVLFYLWRVKQTQYIFIMKTFTVTYKGQALRFANFNCEVLAETERKAVIDVYSSIMDENYFPQEDGSIQDCDGNEIADNTDERISYDGGYFLATEVVED